MLDEKTSVPNGTFERKVEAKELHDFVSKSNGEVTSNEDGIVLSKKVLFYLNVCFARVYALSERF